DRPDAAGGREQAAQGHALQPRGGRQEQAREEGGGGHAHLRVGGGHAALEGGHVRPALQQVGREHGGHGGRRGVDGRGGDGEGGGRTPGEHGDGVLELGAVHLDVG